MNKKNYFFGGVIIVIAILGIILSQKKSTNFSITVADPKAVGWAPFFVAMDKGFFIENGINVNDVAVQTGDESMKALISNSADIALAGIIPYSFVALDNENIKIISQAAYNSDNQIIAKKSAGISKPEDLKDKNIGYAKTTASDIGIQQFLENWGIKKEDVNLINLKPLAMPGALAAGQIDAYSVWEPAIINGRKLLGDEAIIFDDAKSTYTWHSAIMAHKDYIEKHKVELKKFIAAWKKAEEYIKVNPDESISITAKYTNIPAEFLKQVWSKYEFYIGLKDVETILNTDLKWANQQRENPVSSIPDASKFINYSIND